MGAHYYRSFMDRTGHANNGSFGLPPPEARVLTPGEEAGDPPWACGGEDPGDEVGERS